MMTDATTRIPATCQGRTDDPLRRPLAMPLDVPRFPLYIALFFRDLDFFHIEGGYLFVHAGIQPGVPIEKQTSQDLLWIREEFIASQADHGHCVVHGHTIFTEPEIRPNRIGIDTGAYFSNVLSCLVLEGTEQRFIQT